MRSSAARFLLVAAAERRAGLLADDREHRLVVELRVVQAVQQVDRTGTGRCEADADLAGELRVGARHERSRLLVTDLHELDVAAAVESAHDPVDAVSGIAVDAPHAPLRQTLHEEVADVHQLLSGAVAEPEPGGP